jgi:hypothetical protein
MTTKVREARLRRVADVTERREPGLKELLPLLAGVLRANEQHFAAIIDRDGPDAIEDAEDTGDEPVIEVALADLVALVSHLRRAAGGVEAVAHAEAAR